MMKVKLGLNRLLGVMALVAIGITPAHATIATFNFEGQSLGAFSSVTDTQSNLTVTVTATSSGVVDVANSSTAVFGTRSLTTFFSNTLENLIFDFSQPLTAFSIAFGDFNQDPDTGTLTAYSGAGATGSVLDTDIGAINAASDINLGQFGLLSVTGAGISSVFLNVAGTGGFSVFVDNASATFSTSVPEPATLALLGLGLAGLGFSRRKQ